MRVTVVDPPAYTPPYDHSLCTALAQRGLEVELATSRFRHGPVPPPEGYRRRECFYRLAGGSAAAKGLQHPFDMLALARRLRADRPDIVHFQWLPLPEMDRTLVRAFPRPRVVTAHDLLPRGASARRRKAALEALTAFDAVIVHSEVGRRTLLEQGLPPATVSVVPHGAFDYLTRSNGAARLDPAVGDLDGRKVVLAFGLVRPYKGIDVLVEAFAQAPEDAVLLVVGRAMMPLDPLRRRARELGIADRVRFVPHFVTDPELPPYFRRADVVVLPYREIDQSGVLFTALAFHRPLLVTAVGGFAEVAEQGAAKAVPPNDAAALGRALGELLADDRARVALARGAERAAAGPYSWARAAEVTEDLYRSLTKLEQ
jgi:glycosyltransferase involved in cell wall biosynthesis